MQSYKVSVDFFGTNDTYIVDARDEAEAREEAIKMASKDFCILWVKKEEED